MKKLLFALLTVLVSCSSNVEKDSILQLRLRMPNTFNEESWHALYQAIRENAGCCDEVWFSTGIDLPPMDVHREHVRRLLRAKEDLSGTGVTSSVQIQMTLGHGDPGATPSQWGAKTWRGWTGSNGTEDLYCNCPRQPEFLEYLREMTRLYAGIEPRRMWIDDDLRYDNHLPASKDSRAGCWCETCLAEFSAAEGRNWTREALDKAMAADAALEERWKQFSMESLVRIARIITEETLAVSPGTRMGYQKTFSSRDTTVVREILKTLAEASGNKVSYRPGGGNYYDNLHPAGQIIKSMEAARFMRELACPEIVEIWCPEVESYPRHYASRTAQSVLLEGFSALGFGADAVSMFVLDSGEESIEVQSRSMLHPISRGARVLREYARANKGTKPAGFVSDAGNAAMFSLALSGIPVLPGDGLRLGTLPEDMPGMTELNNRTSSQIQDIRNSLPGSPVLCTSPFIGMVIPRVDADGAIRTLGLINCRIDSQSDIRFKLPGLPEGTKHAVWRELKKKAVRLKIRHTEDGTAYVEVPGIDAWNAGFLEFPI
ncbi:MAG: hypothetical protein IJ222_08730 [Bacteroidales bacterium]|nr:hypothetical protein [Bacteroidales bacterium]